MKRFAMIFVIATLMLAPALNSSPAIAATGGASDIISDSLFSDDFRTWENQLKNKRTSIRPSSVAAAGTQRTPAWYRQQALSTARGGGASAIPAAATAAQGTTKSGLAKVGGKISGAAGAAGQVAMGVAGVTMVYDVVAGGLTANLFGVESNGLWCDLGQVFNSSACQVVPAPEYPPNVDVFLYAPGWVQPYNGILDGDRSGELSAVGQYSLEMLELGGGDVEYTYSAYFTPLTPRYTWRFGYDIYELDSSSGIWKRAASFGGSRGGIATAGVDVPTSYTLDLFNSIGRAGPWFTVEQPIGGTLPQTFASWQDAAAAYPGQGVYLAPNVADRPTLDANPARRWSSTWQCEGGPGTTTQSAVSPEFFETDEEWPAFPEPSCESTQTLTWWKIDQLTTGLDPFTVYEWEIDQETQALLDTLSPEEKAGTHFLELYRLDQGYQVSCFDNPSLCADWFEDPLKSDNYVCKYGDETVSLAECSLYAPTFRYTDYRQGIDYADPDTGVSTAPIVTPAEPAQSPDCPPPFSWTSLFNPWYYYKASICALEWAFVPTIDFGLKFETAGWHIQGSFIGGLQRFLDGIVGAFDVGHLNRCGLLVDTSPTVFRGASLTVDTCSGFWAQAGPLRILAGAGFVVGSAFMAIKILLRLLNVHVEQAAASDN